MSEQCPECNRPTVHTVTVSGTCLGVCNTCQQPFVGAPAAQETAEQLAEALRFEHRTQLKHGLVVSGNLPITADKLDSLHAELARLKDSLEILGERADLEKMRADIAEEKVARLQSQLFDEKNNAFQALHQIVTLREETRQWGEKVARLESQLRAKDIVAGKLAEQVARLEKERDGLLNALKAGLAVADCRPMDKDKVEAWKNEAKARIRNLENTLELVDCNDCAVRWSCSLETDGPEFKRCPKCEAKIRNMENTLELKQGKD